MNVNLKKVKKVDFSNQYVYVADFGRAQEETDSDESIHVNSGMLSRVIVIRNDKFKQISSPFPYYQKALSPSRDGKNIKKMNDKLWAFYNSQNF